MRRLLVSCLLCFQINATIAADPAPPAAAPQPPYGPAIDLATARGCVAAASAEAAKNGWLMVITVVDNGGHTVLTERMDNAQFGSVEPAYQKAYTAAAFRRPTKVFEDLIAQGGAGLRILRLPDALPIEGGLPILSNGAVIGAVGASGGTAQQDGVVVAACVQALSS
jgi:uncharacterized protein GlcG (DUF336 family)